ncbi:MULTISPECIES: DUF4432 family protein [Chelativorans]|uniref:DUF4432 family protein n=1 Tax=Chelativorans intermedius TaxID=515947 RepID=A0ABV6DCQ1_9HYPH|nr:MULTISPECIES: DUF4432 family protein [Chelativorans]MCT9000656.1 DUF4432 family protein [Chelativorans intermedius]WEX12179.1 DUF4432 family protein [Chelativorans sp. AA-79]
MLPAPSVLRSLVGDLKQVASLRRVTLMDGPEAGVEALVFSTGGGLDFWVVPGRMLDIAALSWHGSQIAWQSPAGMRPVDVSGGDQRVFEHGFGGFLNTCGFDHIRQPVDGLPLHGSAPFTPARLLSFGENWDAEEPILRCEGEATCWRHGGYGYRLRRRIEAPIGGATIRIRDRVEIIGPDPAAVLALYHFNLGYPAVRNGTQVLLDGNRVVGPLSPPESKPQTPTLHRASAGWAVCHVVLAHRGAAIAFRWRTDTLPWLQLWRDLRPHRGVLSIEPCSIGRLPDGANEPSPPINAGEARSFAIDIAFASNPL